jgi:hypothetical protein
MTISLKHNRVSAQPDDLTKPELVQPSEWNDEHTLLITGPSVIGKPDAGAGPVVEMSGAEVLSLAGAQPLDGTLTALAGLDASVGLVEQTGDDTFAKRALGVAAGTSVPTRADADARFATLAHNHTGGSETLVPEAGLDIANAPADRWILSYDSTAAKMEWITTTIYPATSVSLITGTLNAGSITSFATRNDADIYDVQEVGGVPGIDIRVSFANVTAFNMLRFQVDHIDGTGTHKVEYALWNVTLAQWDLLTSLRTTNGFVEADVNADDFANYIDTGASNTVICRMYHPVAGNGGHQHKWEYMVLVDSVVGGGGISEHGALSGLDTAGSHPASAISNIPAGTIASTDMQAVVNELDGDITNHVANVSNPHVVTKTQVGLGNVTNDSQLTRAAGDFSTFANKATPVGADVLLIEDSAAAGAKKNIAVSTLLGAGSGYTTFEDEGTPVTQRATANFTGGGVTVTDSGGKTVVSIPGAAGATDIRAATITAPYESYEYEQTVTDGDVTPASNVMLMWGSPTVDDENSPDMDDINFRTISGTGSFTAIASSQDAFGGPLKLHYLIG